MSGPPSILYVDDGSPSTGGVPRALLTCDAGVLPVGIGEARERVDEDADCVVVDLSPEAHPVFEFVKWAAETHPTVPVVVMLDGADDGLVARALECGAVDCIPKSELEISETLVAHRVESAAREGERVRAGRGSSADIDDPDDPEPPASAVGGGDDENAAATAASAPADRTQTTGSGKTIDTGDGDLFTLVRTALRDADADASDGGSVDATTRSQGAEAGTDASERVRSDDDPGIRANADEEPTGSESDRDARRGVDSSPGGPDGGHDDTDDSGFDFDIELQSGPEDAESGSESSGLPVPPVDSDEDGGVTTASTDGAAGDERRDPSPTGTDEGGRQLPAPDPLDERPHEGDPGGPSGAADSLKHAGDSRASDKDADPEPDVDPTLNRPPASGGMSGVDTSPVDALLGRDGAEEQVDTLLVRCPAHDDRREDVCTACLGLDGNGARDVLLIAYAPIDEARLGRIAAAARRVAVLSVGSSQPTPDDERVEVTEMPTPGDVTRLGIVVTRILREWDATTTRPVVCYDSLTTMLQYKQPDEAFQFLHLLSNQLRSAGVAAHFHVDPEAADPEAAAMLEPLFDDVVTVDDG